MATSFSKYAEQFLKIDMTDDGELYAEVPAMGGDWFRVNIDESGLVPVATSCRCHQCKKTGHCQHTDIVNRFYARIYKSNVAKAAAQKTEVVKVETPSIKLNFEQSRLVSFLGNLPSRQVHKEEALVG